MKRDETVGMDIRAQDVLAGNRRALARLLTQIENERGDFAAVLAALYPHTGRAWVIGVTGAPGTGKSSLVAALTKQFRASGKRVGVIAVDPTSPFTGGAILGDRIRMREVSLDEEVFIRSMAARGSLGGLSRATRDATRAMDAAGFEIILIETVGAGQNEVEIVRAAHTVVVVEAPGLGDDVQAIKAGILEIADVLVVNKADRPGAMQTFRALKSMLELGHPAARSQLVMHHGRLLESEPSAASWDGQMWLPPIVQTVATENKGLAELMEALSAHRQHLLESGNWAQLERQQIEIELNERLQAALLRRLKARLRPEDLANVLENVQNRTLDPHQAVVTILQLSGLFNE